MPLGDDWLEITPDQLDQMIYDTQGVKKVTTLRKTSLLYDM